MFFRDFIVYVVKYDKKTVKNFQIRLQRPGQVEKHWTRLDLFDKIGLE